MRTRAMRALAIVVVTASLLGCAAYRQAGPLGASAPTSPAVELDADRRVTSEGLTVLHVRRQNLPMVVFRLYVSSGAVREPAGLSGVSSITAGLLMEGTKSRTSEQISQEIEYIGASLGPAGGMDYVSISLAVLKKDIETGFDIFSDILLNPTFPEKELARVKKMVLGSLRQQEESPSFLVERAFSKAVFGEHPYGRLVQGSPETVGLIQRSDVEGFYDEYYAPNNSILAVVGDITGEELDALLDKYLSGWKRKPIKPLELPEPPGPSRRLLKIEKDLTQANITMGHVGVSRDNPDYYALLVMNYVLGGGGFSSRLMGSIRDDMGLAYDVHSYFAPGKHSGSFRASVQTKNSSANTVISEMLRQIRRMRDEKISAEELSEAKAYLIGSYPRKLETMSKVADFLAQVEFFGLGLDYIGDYPGLINAVTVEDVQRVARKYLDPENFVLVVVADQQEADVRDPLEPDVKSR